MGLAGHAEVKTRDFAGFSAICTVDGSFHSEMKSDAGAVYNGAAGKSIGIFCSDSP
jgi:hypothetical protein